MGVKSGSLGAQEALKERFADVFDIDIVLGYDFGKFFDFCQYLGYYGYDPGGGVDWRLQSPKELVTSHRGNCWEQTELQRLWFQKHGYRVKTFLLYYYVRDDFCPSHSILMYRENGEWVWFEPMFCGTAVEYSGLHRYGSEVELLEDFRRVFALNGQKSGLLPKSLEDGSWTLYEYAELVFGKSDGEFYDWCRTGKLYVLAPFRPFGEAHS